MKALLRSNSGQAGMAGLVAALLFAGLAFAGYWFAGLYPIWANIVFATIVSVAILSLVLPKVRANVVNAITSVLKSVPVLGAVLVGSIGGFVLGHIIWVVIQMMG